MALIECNECKKKISDKADKCPNCGYPIKEEIKKEKDKERKQLVKEKKPIIVKSVLISLIVIAMISIIFIIINTTNKNNLIKKYTGGDNSQVIDIEWNSKDRSNTLVLNKDYTCTYYSTGTKFNDNYIPSFEEKCYYKINNKNITIYKLDFKNNKAEILYEYYHSTCKNNNSFCHENLISNNSKGETLYKD